MSLKIKNSTKQALICFSALAFIETSPPAKAVTWGIIEPFGVTSLASGSIKIDDFTRSVGSYSIQILESIDLNFSASEQAIESIADSPSGLDAYHILSDRDLKAFGWCFTINGEILQRFMSEVYFTSQNDHLEWYFGYVNYHSGKWESCCIPAVPGDRYRP